MQGETGRAIADDRWAERLAALTRPERARPPKPPLSVERIVDVALELIEADGFEALTMRRVATVLQTGPASLYAHVRNKADLDDLLIGRLCSRVNLPTPDPTRWPEQLLDVCRQLRDQFLRYPGVSQAALAAMPTSIDTLRINEGMLAILLAGGVAARSAAWAIDAAYLYVAGYSLEASLRDRDAAGRGGREPLAAAERLRMLPADRFPNTVAHAAELTSGAGHERFDFTLDLLFRGLASD
ncbi:MAG: TetR/AcrR family transcriptional regulator C-terminal domain-containing protein [Propionicimonas sp.]